MLGSLAAILVPVVPWQRFLERPVQKSGLWPDKQSDASQPLNTSKTMEYMIADWLPAPHEYEICKQLPAHSTPVSLADGSVFFCREVLFQRQGKVRTGMICSLEQTNTSLNFHSRQGNDSQPLISCPVHVG